jgi:hypothetical protein
VDEARQVIARLERIDALERQLLDEVRQLVAEGERWVCVEGEGAEAAAAALDRCRRIVAEHA